ncbi:hypothetical protein ACIO1C_29455 [Streptomyces sp. NPDC087420]|uniref:hypothetical protein n=1 Tax=Streptomyces sp. NPDC087420 TaxID=3365785 RepID=UPI0038341A27
MNARGQLLTWLCFSFGAPSAEAAEAALDAYAHELAEKIRWAKGPDSADQRFLIYANGWYDGRGEAADLIDPECEIYQRECACDGETSLRVHTAVDCYDLPEVST